MNVRLELGKLITAAEMNALKGEESTQPMSATVKDLREHIAGYVAKLEATIDEVASAVKGRPT